MGEPANDTRPPLPPAPIVFLTASLRTELAALGRARHRGGRPGAEEARALAILDELERHAVEAG